MRSSSLQELFTALKGYVTLTLLCGLGVGMAYADVILFGRISELSITEIGQSFLLFATALVFMRIAYCTPDKRGFAILAAGLFLCMLVREQNNLLEKVGSGFWEILVTLVVVVSIYWAAKYKGTIVAGLLHFLESRSGALMAVGLIMLLLFSRLMGTTFLWESLLQEAYLRPAKQLIEESCELLSYFIMCYAAFTYGRQLSCEQKVSL